LASSACPRRQRRHWPPTVRKMGPVAWPPQLASRHTLGPQPARWGFGDQDERPPPLGARARPFNGLRPSAGDAWHNSQLTAMNSWAPALLPRRHRFARCSTSNGAATRAAHPSYALFGPASGAGGRGATSFWPAPRQNPTKIPRVRARATLQLPGRPGLRTGTQVRIRNPLNGFVGTPTSWCAAAPHDGRARRRPRCRCCC
jgi:hypothetical protein